MRWIDRVGSTITERRPATDETPAPEHPVETRTELERVATMRHSLAVPARVAHLSRPKVAIARARAKPRPAIKTLSVARLQLSKPVLTRALAINPGYQLGLATRVPPPQRLDPVRTDSALLFPNRRTSTAMYTALQPIGVSTTLVVRTEEVEDTVRVTGGSLTLAVSGLPLRTDAEIEQERVPWTAALRNAGHRAKAWRFTPLHVRSLRVDVDLPSNHVTAAPTVSANADTVEAVAVIELTAAGTQAWQQALDAADPASLVGSVEFTITFAAERPDRSMATQSHRSSTPIGTAVAASVVTQRRTRAEVGIDGRLVVRGHPTIDSIAIDMRTGNDAQSLALTGEGGEVSMTLATTEPRSASIEWSAEVAFSSSTWPMVSTRGVLSDAEGWAAILAPATWVRPLDVLTMLVDEDGVSIAGEVETSNDRVTGSVELDAPYLEGRVLHTTFEGHHNEMVTMHLPDPPGETRGTLSLSAMVLRGGRISTVAYELRPDDRWVIMKVFPSGQVEFSTNATPTSEFDRGGAEHREMLALF